MLSIKKVFTQNELCQLLGNMQKNIYNYSTQGIHQPLKKPCKIIFCP